MAISDSRRTADSFGRLSVAGNRIVGNGRTAILRGMSLFWSQWMPQFYNASAIRWLVEDWKVDVIRAAVGVHHRGYLRAPEREFAKVCTVIETAIELGIYVIVDWHSHVGDAEQARRFFVRIARAYGRYPNLIYETWNEPHGRLSWAGSIKRYHERVIAGIRDVDPDNLIVAGTPHWSHRVDIAAADPLRLPNVAYSLHFYAASHSEGLRTIARAALDSGVALMVTEWGTCRADARGHVDAQETARWLAFLEAHSISYVNWSIADKDEAAAALLPGAADVGGWPTSMLSTSGSLVRDHLRAMRPRSTSG